MYTLLSTHIYMLTNPGVHLSNSGVQPPAEGVHRAAAKSPVAPDSPAAGALTMVSMMVVMIMIVIRISRMPAECG